MRVAQCAIVSDSPSRSSVGSAPAPQTMPSIGRNMSTINPSRKPAIEHQGRKSEFPQKKQTHLSLAAMAANHPNASHGIEKKHDKRVRSSLFRLEPATCPGIGPLLGTRSPQTFSTVVQRVLFTNDPSVALGHLCLVEVPWLQRLAQDEEMLFAPLTGTVAICAFALLAAEVKQPSQHELFFCAVYPLRQRHAATYSPIRD